MSGPAGPLTKYISFFPHFSSNHMLPWSCISDEASLTPSLSLVSCIGFGDAIVAENRLSKVVYCSGGKSNHRCSGNHTLCLRLSTVLMSIPRHVSDRQPVDVLIVEHKHTMIFRFSEESTSAGLQRDVWKVTCFWLGTSIRGVVGSLFMDAAWLGETGLERGVTGRVGALIPRNDTAFSVITLTLDIFPLSELIRPPLVPMPLSLSLLVSRYQSRLHIEVISYSIVADITGVTEGSNATVLVHGSDAGASWLIASVLKLSRKLLCCAHEFRLFAIECGRGCSPQSRAWLSRYSNASSCQFNTGGVDNPVNSSLNRNPDPDVPFDCRD